MRPATNAEADRFEGGGRCPFCGGREFREGEPGGVVIWTCPACAAGLKVGAPHDPQFWPRLLGIVAEPTKTPGAGSGHIPGVELGGAGPEPTFAELMPVRDRPRSWRP
jgi:hypothetical protein